MLTQTRHGALTIVEQTRDRDWINRELRQIDPNLFVEKQLTYAGEEVWCVVCEVDSSHPPITILEWRDELSSRPIAELSSGLINRVARMERDGAKLAEHVKRLNAAKIERDRRDSYDKYREIALDMVPRMSGLRSAVLPRGQWLRMSRDKMRAQGRKV